MKISEQVISLIWKIKGFSDNELDIAISIIRDDEERIDKSFGEGNVTDVKILKNENNIDAVEFNLDNYNCTINVQYIPPYKSIIDRNKLVHLKLLDILRNSKMIPDEKVAIAKWIISNSNDIDNTLLP